MKKDITLVIAIVMTITFTIALYFASTIIVFYTNQSLLEIFPDYGIGDYEISSAIRESLMPLGLTMFAVTIVLIIIGFILKKGWVSVTGSIALYLPVFGSFSITMFYLAGIGIFRVLWIPLIEIVPEIFELGHVVLVPYFFILEIFWADIIDFFTWIFLIESITSVLIFLGITIFMVGTTTWFRSRLRDEPIVDSGIYRYSRHPQYLGYLMWSYGLLMVVRGLPVAYGGIFLIPSFPWLIGLFVVLAVAAQEELWMVEKYGEVYSNYRSRSSFLFPIPKLISEILKRPIRVLFKKDWPTTRKEIAVIILFYLIILILLSIPVARYYN